MICNNCELKEICKTYDYIINVKHAIISVNDCGYHLTDNNSFKKVNTTNTVNETRQARPDLRELEKKINNIQDKPKSKLIKCPTCNGTTYEDDLNICSVCGKTVCSNCGTVSDGMLYCEDCWKKL